jgi:hypothetical protein
MPALTEAEAPIRAGLFCPQAYGVFLDLTADPVRSRTEIRFGCAEPGAAMFADLSPQTVLSAVLNGTALGQPADGRLSLPRLDADNVLTVEAEVAYSETGDGLARFTDPADGAVYVSLTCYPVSARASGTARRWRRPMAWPGSPSSARWPGSASSGTSGCWACRARTRTTTSCSCPTWPRWRTRSRG